MRRRSVLLGVCLGLAGSYRADDWEDSPIRYTGELKMPADWAARAHEEGRWFATDYEKEFGLDWDDLPEQAFHMVGGIGMVQSKASTLLENL